MQSILFIVIVLCSGALAGAILGASNIILTEPYLDNAIMIESQEIARSGVTDEETFWSEYEGYRQWQKGGLILAAVVLGVAISALYGLVYMAYSRFIPGRNQARKMIVLAGSIWITLYIVPFIKYPTVLPGDGDAATLEMRTMWYVALVVLSGLSAITLHRASLLLHGAKKMTMLAAWIVIVGTAIVTMPSNPDSVSSSQETLDGFRAATLASITIYWTALAVICVVLLGRFGRSTRSYTRIK